MFYVVTPCEFDDPLSRVSGKQKKCQSSVSGDSYNPTGRRVSSVYKMVIYPLAMHCSSLFPCFCVEQYSPLCLLFVICRICCRAYRTADENTNLYLINLTIFIGIRNDAKFEVTLELNKLSSNSIVPSIQKLCINWSNYCTDIYFLFSKAKINIKVFSMFIPYSIRANTEIGAYSFMN